MAKKGPGRAHREGITVVELARMFPDDSAAEAWFEAQRWPEGRHCPECGSTDTVAVKSRRPMPYRCRDCRAHFSVRKGTVMQDSKLGLQKWAFALYMMSVGLKGVSSMRLHRDLGVRQATAWHLMQRIREGFLAGEGKPLAGPVEVDETYFGGRRKNMHRRKRKELSGRGPVGKVAVVGARDRATKTIVARVAKKTDAAELQPFVLDNTATDAVVYTDDASAYEGLRRKHETVRHSAGEYVRGQAHINGIESFWATLKRAYKGTFHHFSEKHLNRYVREFAGRHNVRDLDTIEQMCVLARGMIGKRLRYRDLVAAS